MKMVVCKEKPLVAEQLREMITAAEGEVEHMDCVNSLFAEGNSSVNVNAVVDLYVDGAEAVKFDGEDVIVDVGDANPDMTVVTVFYMN